MLNGKRQSGFTYIGLLMMIAISGIALAGLGDAWHTASQREKEQELLFAGQQISDAIASYHQATPSPVKQYPATLAALLDDRRGPKPLRHLRRLYIDPMTSSRDWGLVMEQQRIVGVYSRSSRTPFKQENFGEKLQGFAGAAHYKDWQFLGNQRGENSTAPTAPDRSVTPDPSTPAPANPAAPATPVAGAGASADPERYSRCGAALDGANLACQGICSEYTSPACRSCLHAAFDSYRQCLR